jgi:hypothetical protein
LIKANSQKPHLVEEEEEEKDEQELRRCPRRYWYCLGFR